MRFALSLAFLLLAIRLGAQNAPVDLPCGFKDQVKDNNAWRIVTPNVIYVNCDVTDLARFSTTAALYAVTPDGPKLDPDVRGTVSLFSGPWIKIVLVRKNGGPALDHVKGRLDYQIRLAPDGGGTVQRVVDGKPAPLAGPFASLDVPISTAPSANVGPTTVASMGATFRVKSNIALARAEEKDLTFAEINSLHVATQHTVTADWLGTTVAPCSDNCPDPAPAGNNPVGFGMVALNLGSDQLHQPKVTIQVTGLRNVFGDAVKVQSDVALGSVPKTKDDSMYYIKADHQAGPGSLPGYAVEAKAAPQVGRPLWLGYIWKPAMNMDIGAGTVSNVKVNDTIIPSLGLTRLYRRQTRGLEAIRVTPALSFETNREFNKKNLLWDQEFKFYFSDLSLSRAQRSWVIFNRRSGTDKTLVYSPDLSNWGAGVQFFAGSEIGHALMEQTVMASKSTATVKVPAYGVARIRPRVTAFAEYKRVSLSFTAALRYLFDTEYATREAADGKSIRLTPVSGFRPYGEAGIAIGLDASGHIALSSTYKLGSQPPTFNKANTVQTGLQFRY